MPSKTFDLSTPLDDRHAEQPEGGHQAILQPTEERRGRGVEKCLHDVGNQKRFDDVYRRQIKGSGLKMDLEEGFW